MPSVFILGTTCVKFDKVALREADILQGVAPTAGHRWVPMVPLTLWPLASFWQR